MALFGSSVTYSRAGIFRGMDSTASRVSSSTRSALEAHLRCRRIEMLPQDRAGENGGPETTTNNITSVIQTVLAAQLVSKGLLEPNASGSIPAARAELPSSLPPASRK